mgnify:CR=1 FL=1
MGDVALTLPVLKAFVTEYPGIDIVLVTRKAYGVFFREIQAVDLFTPDFKKRHSGFAGIFRLFMDLRKRGGFDCVIDLHDVLRSKIIGFLFRISGTRVVRIDKGRKEKNDLIRGRRKTELKHTVERYSETFSRAGFPLVPRKGRCIHPGKEAQKKANALLSGTNVSLNIGIAPFAKHPLKQWPTERMVQLIRMISDRRGGGVRFWLFGGEDERERLAEIEMAGKDIISLCGTLTLEEELAVIGELDFMIAMDSSNMHMAVLAGTKVLSIWGGTDPSAGFGAWGEPPEHSVYISAEELDCRPCTVYGKGTCRRGDFACMMRLSPEKVFNRLVELGFI